MYMMYITPVYYSKIVSYGKQQVLVRLVKAKGYQERRSLAIAKAVANLLLLMQLLNLLL